MDDDEEINRAEYARQQTQKKKKKTAMSSTRINQTCIKFIRSGPP